MALGLVETEEEEIRAIDDAFKKIAEGTFGRCEECEQEIARPRLEAIPYARHCMQCQQKLEEEASRT
jgi:DnaK suppressor protein